MKKYGIDRFEGELAVLVDLDGNIVTVYRSNLPVGVKEGDMISFDGEKYLSNPDETAIKRSESKMLIDELFK